MPFTKQKIRELYGRRARHYDCTDNLYYLIGFREMVYRKKAVAGLRLQPGDTVLEIGCGTGLTLGLLQEAVGPQGRIIGVDLTEEMLDQARKRIEREGWSNVELVHQDAAELEFPLELDGIISTFALTLIPEYDEIIERGTAALSPGRRFVAADLKLPNNWIARLAPILVPLVRPFGVTLDPTHWHPWDSMAKFLENLTVEEFYFGFACIAVGEAPSSSKNIIGSRTCAVALAV
ncbi:MAG: class I SAM-dependent methyltransferase [Dehalococcoidia bacterium]